MAYDYNDTNHELDRSSELYDELYGLDDFGERLDASSDDIDMFMEDESADDTIIQNSLTANQAEPKPSDQE